MFLPDPIPLLSVSASKSIISKAESKGKFTQKKMLLSDVRSDKIGKNTADSFSISPLVLKIFAFKVEELVRWRQPFLYANESNMTSHLQE